MSIFSTRAYSTTGSSLYIDDTLVARITSISGLDSGSRNEIDITNLHSQNFREVRLGLADAGSISCSGVLVPQSTSHTLLDSLKNSTLISRMNVLLPVTLDPDTGAGTKTARTIAAFATASIPAIAKGSAGKITEATAGGWRALPGIGTGDYIKLAAAAHRITSVAVISDKAELTIAPPEANITVVSSAASYDILRPPVRYDFLGQVLNFTKNFESDDVGRFSLEVRVSGEITPVLGTPDLASVS